MEKRYNYFIFSFILLYLFFCINIAFDVDFIYAYGVPFGNTDFDNYVCFVGEDISYRFYPCNTGIKTYFDDPIHYFYLNTVLIFSKLLNLSPILGLTIFHKLLFYLVCPFLIYINYNRRLTDLDSCLGMWFIFFGSYFMRYNLLGLMSQLTSICLFLIVLYIYQKHFILSVITAILSFLYHPYILFVYYFLIIYKYFRKYWFLLFLPVLLVFGGVNLLDLTVFSGRVYEMGLDHILLFDVNILFWMGLFYYLLGSHDFKILIFVCIGMLVSNVRGVFFVNLFLVYWLMGFFNYNWFNRVIKLFFLFLVFLMFLAEFERVFNIIVDGFSMRGLVCLFKAMCIYIK